MLNCSFTLRQSSRVMGTILFFLRVHIKEKYKKIGFQDLSDSIVMEITIVTEMN